MCYVFIFWIYVAGKDPLISFVTPVLPGGQVRWGRYEPDDQVDSGPAERYRWQEAETMIRRSDDGIKRPAERRRKQERNRRRRRT